MLVKAHKVAKNREIQCKQHASTEKMLRSPNILWLF